MMNPVRAQVSTNNSEEIKRMNPVRVLFDGYKYTARILRKYITIRNTKLSRGL